jgi:hypothetical protein
MRVALVSILLCLFVLSQTTYAWSEDRPLSNPQSQKKSHKWLIAVGAGAGFAVGLLIGFSAFDQAINSDQKIWTSAAVGAAAGGIGGWLWARELDKESKIQMDRIQQKLNSPAPMAFNTDLFSDGTCKRGKSDLLLLQADCICPSILYR